MATMAKYAGPVTANDNKLLKLVSGPCASFFH